MDKLVSLYERMKKLRESGVRMKDIAEETDIASSVLSSLYSSVLPMYINLLTSSLKKYVFYNCLINNVLYLRVT